jgi:nucleotide-binding universal stress UspA family protein
MVAWPPKASRRGGPRRFPERHTLNAVVDEFVQVLVPIVRSQAAAPLTDIGDSLISYIGGYGRVLALVELPSNPGLDVKQEVARQRRNLLLSVSATDARRTGAGRSRAPVEVRVAHDVAVGIEEAAYEQACDLLVVEWPGLTARRPRLLGRVIDRLSADPPAALVFVRPDPARPESELQVSRILAPIRGGDNGRLALLVAASVSAQHDARLTVLHVYRSSLTPRARQRERGELMRLLESARLRVDFELEEVDAVDAGAVILEKANAYELVVLGAFAAAGASSRLVRSSLVRTVRALPGTVVIVRSARRA